MQVWRAFPRASGRFFVERIRACDRAHARRQVQGLASAKLESARYPISRAALPLPVSVRGEIPAQYVSAVHGALGVSRGEGKELADRAGTRRRLFGHHVCNRTRWGGLMMRQGSARDGRKERGHVRGRALSGPCLLRRTRHHLERTTGREKTVRGRFHCSGRVQTQPYDGTRA